MVSADEFEQRVRRIGVGNHESAAVLPAVVGSDPGGGPVFNNNLCNPGGQQEPPAVLLDDRRHCVGYGLGTAFYIIIAVPVVAVPHRREDRSGYFVGTAAQKSGKLRENIDQSFVSDIPADHFRGGV